MAYQDKFLLARELRKNMTPQERRLWKSLRYDQILGYRFRRQYIIAGFILDFYCPKIKLGIELDGKVHEKQKEQDEKRTKILNTYGIKIFRIKNEDLESNEMKIINNLKSYIESISSPPHLPVGK